MPGSPPTTPRLAIPRYANADAPTFSASTNAVSDMIDTNVAKTVPTVSSWPPSGYDTSGDIVDFQNAAMAAQGVRWRMLRRSSGWDFIGGSPLFARAVGSYSLGTFNVWADPGGVLDLPITIPFGAYYQFRYVFTAVITSPAGSGSREILSAGLAKAGLSPLGETHASALLTELVGSRTISSTMEAHAQFSCDGGDVWGMRYLRATGFPPAGTAVFSNRMICLHPLNFEVE